MSCKELDRVTLYNADRLALLGSILFPPPSVKVSLQLTGNEFGLMGAPPIRAHFLFQKVQCVAFRLFTLQKNLKCYGFHRISTCFVVIYGCGLQLGGWTAVDVGEAFSSRKPAKK